MSRFFPLTVKEVQKTIRDAVVVTLEPPTDAKDDFDFVQGQYLTFRRAFDGEELRRSYSICAGKDDGFLQIGIKRVEDGVFSSWANENLKPGDILEAMPPKGSFHTPVGDKKQNYLAFAAGSGITPVLSILKTVLSREPQSEFTLVYANRAVNTIMFREELEDLKNLHMGRLNIIHILENDAQEIDLFTGLVDKEKCALLFKHWIDIENVDMAFICGPRPMMLAVAGSLKDHGLAREQIKFELFASGTPPKARAKTADKQKPSKSHDIEASINLDGTARTITMTRDKSVLESALENDIDAPFACKAGVCSTCRAKVLEGEVEMAANHALEDYEVNQGYVLTCQCYAVSNRIVVDYDQ